MEVIKPEEIFKDSDDYQVKVFLAEFNKTMGDKSKRVVVLENSDFGNLWKFTIRAEHSKGTELKIRQELVKAGWRVVIFERKIFIDEVFTIYKVGLL